MLPETYFAMKDRVTQVLLQHFRCVNVATEAPEKEDYGDIDFQAYGPVDKDCAQQMSNMSDLCGILKDKLKATRCLYHPTVDTMSFALPLPADMETREDVMLPDDVPSDKRRHFQIDITVSPTRDDFRMHTLLHSHGDWRDILAIALRPIGFVFIPQGFALRVQEVQQSGLPGSEGKCRVVLSQDPYRILDFLGMDRTPCQKGFAFGKISEVFDWMTSSRFFVRGPYEDSMDEAKDSSGATSASNRDLPNYSLAYRNKVGKKRRSMFRVFTQEWLPLHPNVGLVPSPARGFVMNEALSFFHVRDRYEKVMETYERENNERKLWSDIEAFLARQMEVEIPDSYRPPAYNPETQKQPNIAKIRGDKRNRAARALRRQVAFPTMSHAQLVREQMELHPTGDSPYSSLLLSAAQHHHLPTIIHRSQDDMQLPAPEQPPWTVASDLSRGELTGWVKSNWKEVVEIERNREHEALRKKLEAKKSRQAAAEASQTTTANAV